jgi:hypothetical protein
LVTIPRVARKFDFRLVVQIAATGHVHMAVVRLDAHSPARVQRVGHPFVILRKPVEIAPATTQTSRGRSSPPQRVSPLCSVVQKLLEQFFIQSILLRLGKKVVGQQFLSGFLIVTELTRAGFHFIWLLQLFGQHEILAVSAPCRRIVDKHL